jgi:hypothetical protein
MEAADNIWVACSAAFRGGKKIYEMTHKDIRFIAVSIGQDGCLLDINTPLCRLRRKEQAGVIL